MPISEKLNDLIFSKEELSKMEYVKVKALRDTHEGEKEIQQKLAPYEHRAFTRELVSKEGNPALYAASLTAAIPAYYIAKKIGLDVRTDKEEATPASIEQVKQAYIGIGEGLMKIFKNEK